MGKDSKIAWTHHTFNGWIGCTILSEECVNCYARDMMETHRKRATWGKGQPRSRTSSSYWKKPYKWNREALDSGERHRVFCSSLSDVFDDEVDPAWRKDLWKVIRETRALDWLLLTKRPLNVAGMIPGDWPDAFPHAWLGVTAGNQRRWDERVPQIMEVPAAVHFVSVEPMLGPISSLGGSVPDWVICGGESGSRARPMELSWARNLRDLCAATNTRFFFKQLGAVLTGSARDAGDDPESFPEDLKVREYPGEAA